jgi:membrane-associated phospholipid phosphatase
MIQGLYHWGSSADYSERKNNPLSSFLKEQFYFLLGLFLLLSIGFILLFNINKGDELVFFSQNRTVTANFIFSTTNYLGEAYLYVIFCLFFIFYKNWIKAILVLLTGLTAMAFSQILKNYFGHERPIIYFNETIKQPDALIPVPGVEFVSSYTSSFPSGHTTAAFALFSLLAFFTTKSSQKTIWLIPASMAGMSRIYLGHHFLEDVVAGAVLGSLIAFVLFTLHQLKFSPLLKK